MTNSKFFLHQETMDMSHKQRIKNKFFLEPRDLDNFEMKKDGVFKHCEIWFDMRKNENNDEEQEHQNIIQSIRVLTQTDEGNKLSKASSHKISID